MEFVRRGGAVAAGAGGREWREGLSRRVLEGKARRLLQAKGRQSLQGLEVGLVGQDCSFAGWIPRCSCCGLDRQTDSKVRQQKMRPHL